MLDLGVEHGLAAHWAYKEGKTVASTQHPWISDLIEILDHAGSPEELLEHTRMAMYQDRIFAFTPKGELIQLPLAAVRDEFLPADIAPGDLIAVPASGAYSRSMASNYNHVPRPPVVFCSGGDARGALNALELACETVGEGGTVTLRVAEDALQRSAILYDKGGDLHYDLISAWIKSTRGSDPDASLLYLAAMLEGGEDPRFIARRMVVFASEDIGNADPRALQVAVAAAHAVEHVGMPECALNLSQAAIYLALAPKSNASIKALGRARAWVREHGTPEPPAALRSAAYPGAKKLGRGLDYDYPHSSREGVSEHELMPAEAVGERFLEVHVRASVDECERRLVRH